MDMDIERIEPSRTQEGGYFREVTISIVKILVTKVKTPIPASYGKSGASAATAQSTAASARRMDPVYCTRGPTTLTCFKVRAHGLHHH